MNGPGSIGQEYTGKHRRDDGRGLAGPSPWAGRAESYGRPIGDGRPVPGTVPMPGIRPESGYRPDPGQWADADRPKPDRPKPDRPKPDTPEPDNPKPEGTLAAQIMVIAKEPVPGRVKTRLTPPYTPAEAAELAKAALADTLAAVASAGVTRRVLALAGTPGRWLPAGFDVIGQRGGGLDERIAWALADARATCPAPLVLIGMDTPQVTPALLARAAEPLVSGAADATFGLAEDGGFWLLGLREIDPSLVLGVPMSRSDTGSRQLARLHEAGLRVRLLPELADVDTVGEAERIAAEAPGSAFAACVTALGRRAAGPLTAAR